MIISGMVKYKDALMHITRHDDMSADNATSATVEVSNIPSSYKLDKLKMLFENSKRSGGGETVKIDFMPDTGRALITFKDAAGIYLTK